MKRIRRRNPVDSQLMALIINSILYLDTKGLEYGLARVLAFKSANVEGYCDDCEKEWNKCTCEGDREDKNFLGYNLECRYCKQNYCICDYDLQTEDNVIKILVKLSKDWFNNEQLKNLILQMKLEIASDANSKNEKERLEKFLNLLQRKSNPKKLKIYETKKKIKKKKKSKTKNRRLL